MIRYPLHFPIQILHATGPQYPWNSTASVPSPAGQLPCAVPPEFEGPGGGFSPEDFFALAIGNCFAATFQVIAEKSKVAIRELGINGTLTVDRDIQGRPVMKHMLLTVTVDGGDADPARIQRVFEKTTQSCIVIHSIKTEVQFDFSIV